MFDFFIVINDLFNLKKRAVRTAGQCMFDDIIQLENMISNVQSEPTIDEK